MNNSVTVLVVERLVVERHRLLGERDRIARRIDALTHAIDMLQEIECPEGGAAETRPAQDSEAPQPAPVATSLTPAPAAEAPEVEEKAAAAPDAPPPQPEVAAAAPPAASTLGQSDHERRNPPWATEARCNILRGHYPKKARTSREIMRLLEASPGPRIPDWGNIGRYAQDVLGLAPVNRSHAQAASKKEAAVPIAYNDLIARAAEWGITEIKPDDLLAAVNAKAARIGHKPYALQSRST